MGYGTDPRAPKIEGAEYFENVYAFPLPNDTKPVCYYDTDLPTEPQKIEVVDLRSKLKDSDSGSSHLRSAAPTQTTFTEDAKQFAVNNKYALFAAGVAVAVAACVVAPKLITKTLRQN